MGKLSELVAIAFALLAATAVSAEDFAVPIELPKGSVILLTIDKTVTRTEGGQAATQAGTYRYRQDVTPSEGGYTVRQTLVGLEMPGVTAAELQAARTMTGGAFNLSYETDTDLSPVSVVDWPGQVERIVGAMKAAGVDPAAADGTGKLYVAMSAEEGADQLLEQNLIAVAQEAGLDLGKPLSSSGNLDGPFGGPPIKAIFTMELTAVDKAAGTATIKTNESLDTESISAYLSAVLPRLAAQLAPEKPRPNSDDIAGIKFERTTACAYEMDLKSGLTRTADCTKTETGTDGTLKPTTKVERYVMTQILQRP